MAVVRSRRLQLCNKGLQLGLEIALGLEQMAEHNTCYAYRQNWLIMSVKVVSFHAILFLVCKSVTLRILAALVKGEFSSMAANCHLVE